MSNTLPERASLDHLKGQAKALLASFRSGDPDAAGRFAEIGKPQPKLADAQLAVARSYGFESWARLKRFVEGSADRQAALFTALRAGDRERVAAILDQHPALARSKWEPDFGTTTLTVAARRGDTPLMTLLLEHGADPNAISDWWAGGFGPLDFSDEPTTRFLLERGATLTAHAAARLGWLDELQAILARDPEAVHRRGGDGQYPLHFAKTPEIVDVLVAAGAELDARDVDHEGTPAQFQVRNKAVCRRLLEHGATPDVFIAASLDDAPLLERLLDADPGGLVRAKNEPGNPMIPQAPGEHIYTYAFESSRPHQAAVEFGATQCLQVLLDRSPTELRLMGWLWASQIESAEQEADADPEAVARLAASAPGFLRESAFHHRTPVVRFLLARGFPPDEQDGEGMSPLMRGAMHGYADVVEAILPYKPSLTAKNVYGGTALGTCLWGSENSWRSDGDFPATIRLLLEAGAAPPAHPSGSKAVRDVLAAWNDRHSLG